MSKSETIFLSISFIFLIALIAQAFYVRRIKNRLQWFEDWGREYVEKHRENARRDGLTK
jgi:hypothetical protein